MSDLDGLHEFRNNYMAIPASASIHSDFMLNDRRFEGIFDFIYWHYNSCQFFNGFSIAKANPRERRETREEDVIIRCSCGDFLYIERYMWSMRIGSTDLEDIIEDLNYQRCKKPIYNIQEHISQRVNEELVKRTIRDKLETQNNYKKTLGKKGVNAILGLEVEND